jgi:hypothetical protein
MICVAPNSTPRSSDIVHHVAYAAGGTVWFQLLCDAPWVVADSTYHARVATEVNPVSRTMILVLTRDPVDCMSCLVSHGCRT